MWLQVIFSFFFLCTLSGISDAKAPCKVSCVRQNGWCSHAGSTYTLMDCDKDGILDPVCSDHSGQFGRLTIPSGCKNVWPKGTCSSPQGLVCNRKRGWCTHKGSTYLYQDCDGDGIPDPVCTDTLGRFGVIYSSRKCTAVWPNAKCVTKLSTCKRHKGWCRHAGSVYTLMDCDKDGVPDPVCSDKAGNFGIIGSHNGCRSVWPKATCQTKKGPVCARKSGWCTHAGSTFMFKDCDGDGIPDPVCTDTTGRFGVLKSSQKCASGWPNDSCRVK